MKKLTLLLCVVFCLGVFSVLVPKEALAQDTRPCCVGGFKPNKPCVDDADCQDICDGGFRDGKPCEASPCIDACVGGFKDGSNCETDANCLPACVGGPRDGKNCGDPVNCPGGSCSNLGTCSNVGTCLVSNCTGICLKKGPKTPDEPASAFSGLPSYTGEDGSSQPCP